jgi:hypothetical protein
MSLSSRFYLLCSGLVACLLIAAVWLYTSLMPMRFLEGGYPIWAAKQAIIRSCDFGSVIVLGDSRPEAAIRPASLGPRAANLSAGAATPIENYYFARRIVNCPHPPQYVIYSHSISSFVHTNEFLWTNATRYGFITFQNLREIARTAADLHDPSFASTSTPDGLTGIIRDLVYSSGFPSIFTASLVTARGFQRYAPNMILFDHTKLTRGDVIYPEPPVQQIVGIDANLKTFAPLPIQSYYFDKTMDVLSATGSKVLFVPVPISVSTFHAMDNKLIVQFQTFLIRHTERFPNIDIARPVMTPWPDDLFVDGSHFNEQGASLFSERLASCLRNWKGAPDRPPSCDLSWK